jgi:hypothetical protein
MKSTACLCVVLLVLAGCQRGDDQPAAKAVSAAEVAANEPIPPTAIVAQRGSASSSPAALTPAEIPAHLSPEEICERFLDLLAGGEVSDAERLLSKRSAVVTRQAQLKLSAPAGTDTHITVEPAQFSDNKQRRAMVLCRFIDRHQPATEAAAISWMLRKESGSWRITGLVLLENDLPVDLLSFENPADVEGIRELLGAGQPVAQREQPDRVQR